MIMADTNSSKELNAGGYLAAYFYRVPKKNHNAISQNLKKFIPWFVSNGVRLESSLQSINSPKGIFSAY